MLLVTSILLMAQQVTLYQSLMLLRQIVRFISKTVVAYQLCFCSVSNGWLAAEKVSKKGRGVHKGPSVFLIFGNMKCSVQFYNLFNLVLSCRNDTKEDVFVHQVSAPVDIYTSGSRLVGRKGWISCQLLFLAKRLSPVTKQFSSHRKRGSTA